MDGTLLTVYHREASTEYGVDASEQARALVAAGEEQLASADNLLRLAVSQTLIESLRRTETTIEVRYEEPRQFTLETFNGRTVEIDGYLIPLTGEYALGDITTIFIRMDGYRSGPYRNRSGPAELRRLVEGLGVELGPE